MKIEQWDIGKVKPYEKNPRRNDKAVEAEARAGRFMSGGQSYPSPTPPVRRSLRRTRDWFDCLVVCLW
mgnify:CR=1 FL=1